MTASLADALALGRGGLLTGFFVFLRVGAVMALLPAFGERSVPVRVRFVLVLGFTLIVTPAVADLLLPPEESPALLGAALATETVIGLALGAVLRLFVLALQMAGEIAAQATSLSQIFGGGAGIDPQPAFGRMMVLGGLALAAITGLHVRAAEAMILSYDVLPPGHFPDAALLSDWGIGRVAHAFGLAFTLAAPFVIASLIYNVALGVINRAMPQLMVAFVGAPAITAGGLIILFLILPTLLSVWVADFDGYLADPFGAAP